MVLVHTKTDLREQLGETILSTSFSNSRRACMHWHHMTSTLHELGHCMHILVAKQRYPLLAGIAGIQADFVDAKPDA